MPAYLPSGWSVRRWPLGFNPKSSHAKESKIATKVEQSRKRNSVLPYASV